MKSAGLGLELSDAGTVGKDEIEIHVCVKAFSILKINNYIYLTFLRSIVYLEGWPSG